MRFDKTALLPSLLSAMAVSAIALLPGVTHADLPRVPLLTCTDGGLTGHPLFTQVSPGRAEYHFSGVCTGRDGRSLGYRVAATWTPSETRPGNANASEIFRIDMLSGPSRSFDVVIGARCPGDPWLNGVNCVDVGDNIPDELRALWPDLAESPFPYSRRGIPYDQRPALLAEYARANGQASGSPAASDRLRRIEGGSYGAAAGRRIGGVVRPADEVSLNPQPLPPRSPDARLTRSARSRLDQVSLNPQPLPPGPPDTPTAEAASSRAAQAGIIIVSGKPLRLRVDTPPAVDAPSH